MDWSIYNDLHCELALENLKAHYNSYLVAGYISIYNLVSIMSAFEQEGWKVSIEPQAGGGYLNICLILRKKGHA